MPRSYVTHAMRSTFFAAPISSGDGGDMNCSTVGKAAALLVLATRDDDETRETLPSRCRLCVWATATAGRTDAATARVATDERMRDMDGLKRWVSAVRRDVIRQTPRQPGALRP